MSTDQEQPGRPQHTGGACPSEVEIAALVDGLFPADQHAAILAHVESCPHCAALVGAVAKTAGETAASPVPPDLIRRAEALVSRQGSRFRLVTVPLLAAAACLVLAAVVWNPARQSPTTARVPSRPVAPSVAPDDARSPGEGAVPVLLQPPPGQLRSNSVPFAWTRVPGAAFYEVRVTTTDGDTIWTSSTEGTDSTWDGRGRRSRTKYFAWVSATMADGRRATSPIVALQDGAEP